MDKRDGTETRDEAYKSGRAEDVQEGSLGVDTGGADAQVSRLTEDADAGDDGGTAQVGGFAGQDADDSPDAGTVGDISGEGDPSPHAECDSSKNEYAAGQDEGDVGLSVRDSVKGLALGSLGGAEVGQHGYGWPSAATGGVGGIAAASSAGGESETPRVGLVPDLIGSPPLDDPRHRRESATSGVADSREAILEMAGDESVRRGRQRKRALLFSVGLLALPLAAAVWALLSGLPELGPVRSALTIALAITTLTMVRERLAAASLGVPLRLNDALLRAWGAESDAERASLPLKRAEQNDLGLLRSRLEEDREKFLVRELLVRGDAGVADSSDRGCG